MSVTKTGLSQCLQADGSATSHPGDVVARYAAGCHSMNLSGLWQSLGSQEFSPTSQADGGAPRGRRRLVCGRLLLHGRRPGGGCTFYKQHTCFKGYTSCARRQERRMASGCSRASSQARLPSALQMDCNTLKSQVLPAQFQSAGRFQTTPPIDLERMRQLHGRPHQYALLECLSDIERSGSWRRAIGLDLSS